MDAAFASLLQQAVAETDPQRRDALGMAVLRAAAHRMETREPTAQDALVDDYESAVHRQDWAAAETAARRLLDTPATPMRRYREYVQLAAALQEQGRYTEALAAAEAATASARESGISSLVIMAVRAEAVYAARAAQQRRALDCLEEGISLAAAEGSLVAWQHADFLVRRAELLVSDPPEQQDLASIAADVRAAGETLQPYATSMMMAGPVAALGRWWHVTAQIRLRLGDVEGARQANREQLWFARRIAEMSQLAEHDRQATLARSLERFATVAEQTGDAEAAAAARREAATIRAE